MNHDIQKRLQSVPSQSVLLLPTSSFPPPTVQRTINFPLYHLSTRTFLLPLAPRAHPCPLFPGLFTPQLPSCAFLDIIIKPARTLYTSKIIDNNNSAWLNIQGPISTIWFQSMLQECFINYLIFKITYALAIRINSLSCPFPFWKSRNSQFLSNF